MKIKTADSKIALRSQIFLAKKKKCKSKAYGLMPCLLIFKEKKIKMGKKVEFLFYLMWCDIEGV